MRGSLCRIEKLILSLPCTIDSNLGLVFQNHDDQMFCPTVRDDLASRLPHNLSGGEKE